MPSATEVLIAEAIVEELNDPGRPWAPLANPAARRWDPWFKEADLADLRMSVIPLTMPPSARLSRGGQWQHAYVVTLDFQQAIDFTTTPGVADAGGCDALAALVEQVQDWFAKPQPGSGAGHRLASLQAWDVVEVQRPEIYIPERLYDEHVWESYLELTVRGVR